MSDAFFSIEKLGESELVVSRSRFLGFACPIEDDADAVLFVQQIRKKYHDARHVVHAFVGDGDGRFNDDGEPSRTGGFPILQWIEGHELKFTVCAVVRYFGGVKLGTGGLSRAYRECGASSIEDAGIIEVVPKTQFKKTIAYGLLERVKYWVAKTDEIEIQNTEFAADVTITFEVSQRVEAIVKSELQVLIL